MSDSVSSKIVGLSFLESQIPQLGGGRLPFPMESFWLMGSGSSVPFAVFLKKIV